MLVPLGIGLLREVSVAGISEAYTSGRWESEEARDVAGAVIGEVQGCGCAIRGGGQVAVGIVGEGDRWWLRRSARR